MPAGDDKKVERRMEGHDVVSISGLRALVAAREPRFVGKMML